MEEVKKQGMESLFCPYEQALALKELGFDEDCLGSYYEEDKSFYMNGVSYSNSYFTKAQELLPEHPQITTPLYQQAFRWFRDKHKLGAIISQFGWGIENEFGQIVHNISDSENPLCYEEAELECLKKLIEIVKAQKE